MAFLRNLMGSVLKFIYEGVASILPNEPSSISYLAISIIIISIIFKVVMFPIFLSSIKNQKIRKKWGIMELYIFFMKLEKHKILCYHYVMKTIYSVLD